jgi:predicted outer membrane repeat protein
MTLPNSRTIKITGSRFENNEGRGGQGGAVWIWLYPPYTGSKVIVKDSWFVGNVVTEGSRGPGLGAGLRTGNGTLLLSSTVFLNNNAEYQGGGLWVGEDAGVNVSNVTFSNNEATHGGAIMFVNKKASVINNTTIAYNHANQHGGGINAYNSGKITLKNSIIAHNTAGNQWGINLNCGGTYSSDGNNIQCPPDNTGSNGHNCASNIKKVNPKLGAFDSVTGTYPLNGDSPAVDFGSNQTCKAVDQRGMARPQGNKCDSGAYELASGALTPAGLIGVPPAP